MLQKFHHKTALHQAKFHEFGAGNHQIVRLG